ncbi:retinol-binding protein 1 [Lynx canadensis]|uniref:retinol-binding protein 1 n=1 Tax=Lynx canadensis TaxID=61383 RepID=UPI0011B00128|nr:retinol-binding protein 1 [Lynx canadensis]
MTYYMGQLDCRGKSYGTPQDAVSELNQCPGTILLDVLTFRSLNEGGRRPETNLALRRPLPPPRPREGGGATAARAPPAGFVRAWNPAVAAPRSPLPPAGAHFRAAHHPDSVGSRCACLLRGRSAPVAPEMPVDFTGYWKMLANENFEEYLRALDVNVALRKIANLLKPDKEIVQDGDHMIIRTLSTFRNYIMDFQVGKEFEEDLTGIDDRKCMMQFSKCHYAHFADENLRLREVKNLFDPRSQPAGGRGRILTGLFIKTTVSWDGDKLECVQKGEKEGRGWTQWIEGDELHLEMRVQGVVCKQVFKKVH